MKESVPSGLVVHSSSLALKDSASQFPGANELQQPLGTQIRGFLWLELTYYGHRLLAALPNCN